MKSNVVTYFFIAALGGTLAACGDGSNSSSSSTPNQTQIVGGMVNGLTSGTQIVLLNKDQSATVNSDGSFVFPGRIPTGAAYRVFLSQQPPNQVCALSDQAGNVSGQDVTNVQVNCVAASSNTNYVPPPGCGCMSSWSYNGQTYTGGICANPDSDPAGRWCKTTSICNGQDWAYCTAASSQSVLTVGGKLSGIDWNSSITLQNNGADNLTMNSNGNFTFPTFMASGASYSVTILSASPSESCTVTNASGLVYGNVTTVIIDCGYPNAAPTPCSCKSSWSYAGSTLEGCADPDSDPNGSWCKTTSTCNGKDWAYCPK